jgi:ankyrin repeat protein
LLWAAKNGHKEVVKLLLAVKADANAKNKQGETALIFAARNGYKDVVELLRQHGGHDCVKPEFAAHDRLASMASFRKTAEEDDLKRIKAQLKYNSDLVVSND